MLRDETFILQKRFEERVRLHSTCQFREIDPYGLLPDFVPRDDTTKTLMKAAGVAFVATAPMPFIPAGETIAGVVIARGAYLHMRKKNTMGVSAYNHLPPFFPFV